MAIRQTIRVLLPAIFIALSERMIWVLIMGETWCLWTDEDAFWQAALVEKLIRVLRNKAQLDVVVGAATSRGLSHHPTTSVDHNGGNVYNPECPSADMIVPIRLSRMHLAAHRLSLLQRLGPDQFTPLPDPTAGHTDQELPENCSFFTRVEAIGGKAALVADAIVGLDGDICYLPGRAPMKLQGVELQMIPQGTVIKPQPPRVYGTETRGSVREPFEVRYAWSLASGFH